MTDWLVLPVPPSANRYWRKFQNRMVVSAEAVQFKAAVAALTQKAKRANGWPLLGGVELEVRWFRAKAAGDLGNRLKVLEDSLQGIAFVNDSQVRRIRAELFDTDRARPRVEVRVSRYQENAA